MLGQIIFLRQKGPHAPELQNAFAAVQHRQLVNAQKLMAELLVIETMGRLPAMAFAGVIQVDGLLAQRRGQFLNTQAEPLKKEAPPDSL